MGVGPSSRETQPRTLIRSRFPDAWMRRAAVGRFPKAEAGVRAACARLRVSTFRALRVPAFTRAEYRGGGRRRDHGATTGRVILPVRAAGRGWRRDRGTTWKWLDMTEEERETAFARIGLACSGRSWHGNQCTFLRKLLKIICSYFKRLIFQNSIAFQHFCDCFEIICLPIRFNSGIKTKFSHKSSTPPLPVCHQYAPP